MKRSFFRQLDWAVFFFIWSGRPPHINKAVLQFPKKLGGLALPNFSQYYWAFNINTLRHWLKAPPGPKQSCDPQSSRYTLLFVHHFPLRSITFHRILWSPSPWKFALNFIQTLCFAWTFQCSSNSFNHFFFVLFVWPYFSLQRKSFLYKENTFTNLTELTTRFGLPNSHIFHFLQTRDFVKYISSFS